MSDSGSGSDDKEITREELQKEIEKILKDADLAKTSSKKVIQQMEKNLGIDLTDKKKMIGQMVMDYINSLDSEKDDEDDEDGGKKVTKAELQKEIEKILKDADLSTTSSKKVLQQMEKNLGLDLTDKKKMISEMVMEYVEKMESAKEEEEEEKPAKKKKKAAGGGKGKGKGSGYTRAYKLSTALSDLMGQEEMPRHEVVKRVWEIIKKKNLYDQNNKQFAICDDALYKVIGIKRFRIFGMMKYLKTHFLDD